MNKICTSIKQSQKLIELGIDKNTADMIYQPTMDIDSMSNVGFVKIPLCFPFNEVKECNSQYLPAWSLSRLLELVPKEESKELNLCFGGYCGDKYFSEWFCSYEEYEDPFILEVRHADNPLDAVFEMICWLKENSKI